MMGNDTATRDILQRMRTELGAVLNGKPAGQESIQDGWLRAGLWPAFSKEAP